MKNIHFYFKKILRSIETLLAILLTTVAALLCFSIMWMSNTWSNLSMDELMYHLTAPLQGTNQSMIMDYIAYCAVPAILVLLFIVMVFIGYRKQKRRYNVIAGTAIIVSLMTSGGFISYAWNTLDIGTYITGQNVYSTFIDDDYVDPRNTELTFPKQKRNLIYIYLESVETTFADKKRGGAFDDNYISELTKLAQKNEDFSGNSPMLNGGYTMPGSTWTIAAMFSQTAGIPLNISIESNSMDTQDSFFSNAITLGDILEQQGYSQTLLLGSEAVFGGRKLYFSEHGNYDILDYNYALDAGWIPPDYRVWWGYEDKRLFEFAKDKLMELSNEESPFNLTLLTVDTHFEDGYLCESCPKTFGDNQYANTIACSSRQVADFVAWAQTQSFYENTSIVIAGDHATMDSDFCKDIDPKYTRKVYTTYINPAVESQTSSMRNYTTFDNFPTTLASMGVTIEGDRLGLGTNLFSNKQTLTERYGIKKMKRELSRKSKLMESLADLNKNTPELLQREGILPSAAVAVGKYDSNTESFPVTVTELRNVGYSVEAVLAAVWTEDDQSDLQWIPMTLQEDGSYNLQVGTASYEHKPGEYNIHVYMTDNQGQPHFLNEAVYDMK